MTEEPDMRHYTVSDIKQLSDEIVSVSEDLTETLTHRPPMPNKFFMDAMGNANICVILAQNKPHYPVFFANDHFLRSVGYSRDQVIGKSCDFLQGPDTSPADIAKIRDALHKEQPVNVVIRNYRKDGSAFWNELYISPVRDASGKTYAFIGIQSILPDDQNGLPTVSLS